MISCHSGKPASRKEAYQSLLAEPTKEIGRDHGTQEEKHQKQETVLKSERPGLGVDSVTVCSLFRASRATRALNAAL